MKLYVHSFGCQMSVADGEEMSRPLLRRGFTTAAELEEADAALINTCTVRQHAEDKAVSMLGRLREWKERRPERLLIVAGCAAERLGESLRKKFPHIDLVVGAKSIEQYPKILKQALAERFDWVRENDNVWNDAAEGETARFVSPSSRTPIGHGRPDGTAARPSVPAESSPVSAYVTIMRGCNYSCSYCIVPDVRGRELYRPMDAVLSEVREKVKAGAREIILLGQTVNSYRSPDGEDFSDLLRAMEAAPDLRRVRFMSPHPYYVDERMTRAMAESSVVCRHLHLPLQSGSDRVLKRMRRNYTAAEFLEKTERLRQAVPGIAITTDVIVGFPGETETDFLMTLEAVRRLDPASAYCFKFSPRPGTQAAGMADDVPLEIKEERLVRLLAIVDDGIRRHLNSWIGRRVRVLLETENFGSIEHYFNASLDRPGRPGELADAVVTGVTRTGLRADKIAGEEISCLTRTNLDILNIEHERT